jgi:DNA adenine methylase
VVRSPLRYPGGKSRAVKVISPLLPSFDEYREPMVGGGSLFCHVRQQFPEKKFWINDLYHPLFCFWEQLQESHEDVIKQIRYWRKEFGEGKQLHRFLGEHLPHFNPVETAAAFFIFNRITFSGTTESGGFSSQAFTSRFTDSSIERLIPFEDILKGVRISNMDYQAVISAPGKNVFLFLDPPYYSATRSALYGKNGALHKNFDHQRFADSMKSCPHRWLITYDDSEFIRELFSFAFIIPWQLTYGMRNITPQSNQTGKELFISNFKVTLD